MANVKFLTGAKADIDGKLAVGAIDNGDIILTSDTDEIVFINPKTGKKAIKSRTQKDYTLKGTNLGGLEDGAVISEGTSIDELLELITQKSVRPTYVSPTIVLEEINGQEMVEVGSSVSASLKSTFTQNDAGAITSHNILKNGEVVYDGSAENSIETTIDGFSIGEEVVIFTSEAEYNAGAIKEDNLGTLDSENAIAAGNIASDSVVLTGCRALFYGAGTGELPELTSANIRVLGNSILDPKEKMEFSIPVNLGQQYVIFAYPSSLRDVSEIMYVEAHDAKMAPNFNMELVEVEGANGFAPAEYKVYTYRMDGTAATSMTFKVII